MSRLRKFEIDHIPEEDAAIISSVVASCLGHSRFVIKKIEPLSGNITLFKKAEKKSSAPDAQYSFFTWRPNDR